MLKRGAERAGVQNATLLKVALPLAGLLLVPATRPELRQLHQYARIPGYDPAHQNYFQLAEFVKANARPGTMVACRKPSLFAVFSDSYATNYAYTENQQAFLDDFRKRKVNLVVIDGLGYASTPRYLVPVVLANPDKFPIIQQLQEPDTFLCGFDDRFGWHGPYNASGLPAGTGEYRFSDGRKLVGSFTDGRFNSLTGTAVLYDADGRPLGPTLWNNGQQTR